MRPGAESGFTLDQVFVGEELWATLNLESGASLLHLSVVGNSAALSYTLEVRQIAGVPASWSGIARDGGLSSNFTVEVPQNGVYTVTLSLSEGAGSLRIDAPTTPLAPASASLASDIVLTQRVTLEAGQHTFTFDPDATQLQTVWALDVSLLREIISLSLTPAEPLRLVFGQGGALELTGTGFDSTSTLVLVDAAGEIVPVEFNVASSTSIALTVPADLPLGSYTFRVTNANAEQVERANALNITLSQLLLYLPIVSR